MGSQFADVTVHDLHLATQYHFERLEARAGTDGYEKIGTEGRLVMVSSCGVVDDECFSRLVRCRRPPHPLNCRAWRDTVFDARFDMSE